MIGSDHAEELLRAPGLAERLPVRHVAGLELHGPEEYLRLQHTGLVAGAQGRGGSEVHQVTVGLWDGERLALEREGIQSDKRKKERER